MIHFFPRFSKDAANSPYGGALRALGVPHRIYASRVQQTYRYRILLLLLGYPALFLSALRLACRSMIFARPRPEAVVISSDVEALVFGLVRAWPFAARPRIVFTPFIYTSRANPRIERTRQLYYRLVLAQVDLAICHARIETQRYPALFAGVKTRFAFIPWSAHVPDQAEIIAHAGAPEPKTRPMIVAAGRSGRDYPTLAAAAAGLAADLVIVCNEVVSLGGVTAGPGVVIRDACFGYDYMRALMMADIAVIPLRVADISAGQMVLIDAMALGRPIIVTHSDGISFYVEDGVTALVVPRADVAAMRAALQRLLDDPDLAARLGAAARQAYLDRFGIEAYFRNLLAEIARL